MRSLFTILIILTFLASACSPQAMPTIQPTDLALDFPTITPTIHLSTDTPPPDPTLTITSVPTSTPDLGFDLPSDCINYDPALERSWYADFSNGACDTPTMSPDELWIAYAVWIPATNSERVRAEVRIVSASEPQSQPRKVYISKCNITDLEWTPTGHLVISDYPQDVGCGYTAIYSLKESRILATLDGANRRWENGWAADKSAFFTHSPSVFGPICAETLSGFDFRTLKTIPKITPVTSGMNIYVIVGKPIWMPDNRTLLATIRDGTCSSEYGCSYGNSYILAVSFTGSAPKVSRPFYDPTIDYSVRQTEEGKIELFSEEFKSVSCMDINNEESRMP